MEVEGDEGSTLLFLWIYAHEIREPWPMHKDDNRHAAKTMIDINVTNRQTEA